MPRPVPAKDRVSNAGEFVLPFNEMDIGSSPVRAARFPDGLVSPSRAMLCVPGYASTGESFARLRALASRCDVRMLTLPGDGWRHHEHIVEYFGSLLAAFAGHFNHPVLLGASFGGLVAIDAAQRATSRISGIVLLSAFARMPSRRLLRLATPFEPLLDFAAKRFEPIASRVLGGPALDPNAAVELHNESASIDSREKQARLIGALQSDMRGLASRLSLPALIIHGTDDRLVPIAAARDLAALLPGSELVEIDGAGHMPYITHPAQTAAAISRFLERIFAVDHQAYRGRIA